MAPTAPKIEDKVLEHIFKWGGIGIIAVIIFVIIAYIFSVAIGLMISALSTLERVSGALGLIGLGIAIGGIAMYVYLTRRVTP
ncbi:MAG: hypothetical protein WC420_03650 [Candidatus Paceibacterota bacterium]|jgi:hypothetical protein